MKQRRRWPVKLGICFLFGLLLGVLEGCKSHSSSVAAQGGDGSATDATSGAHIDILCLGDRINSPSEAFHYSYKYSDATDSIDNEADITPQKIDIMSTDKSGTHSYHGVHSDEASWNAAVLDLSSLRFTGMTSRIDSLNGSSSIVSQGQESVNGYKATKYSIDTTRATSRDQKQFETLFGAGSFEKGTVWVPADGCAVKLILDEAIMQRSGAINKGAINKGHYDIAMIKK